jgi:hypothetical protein
MNKPEMKIPFTVKQFFEVFKNYNEAVFPAQVILYFLALAAVFLTLRSGSGTTRFISGILAFFWLWIGVVYHFIFFTTINKAAYVFGAMFILQAVLLLITGVFKSKLSLKFHPDMYGITGMSFILFALVIYPVAGYFLGHVYPASPSFGLPCPTTIFTFGLLLLNGNRFLFSILIIPFIWSVVGFTAAFKFGMTEDTALIISAIIALAMTLIKNRKYKLV